MLISHSRPDDITFALAGTGAAWLSDDNGAALVDGSPARATRIQWLSGTQTTSSQLDLQATWGTALVPRVLGLVGLTLPVGTLITLAFRRPADGGYTYLTGEYSQRVVELPDGSRCAWFVLPADLDAVIGVGFQIFNDVDGAATIAADSAFDVGEMWIGPGAEWRLRRTVTDRLIDPTARRRSLGSQMFASARRPYRALALEIVPTKEVNVPELRALRGACAKAEPVVVVPVETQVQDTACFGTVTDFPLAAIPQGAYWTTTISVEETPAAAVD